MNQKKSDTKATIKKAFEEEEEDYCCQTGCPGCPYFSEEKSKIDPNIPIELQLNQ